MNIPEFEDYYLKDVLNTLDVLGIEKKDLFLVKELVEDLEITIAKAEEVIKYWRSTFEARHNYVVVYFRNIPYVVASYYIKAGGIVDLNDIKHFPKTKAEAKELAIKLNGETKKK